MIVFVVLKLQSGPQLLSTIVTGQWGGFWIQNISTLGCMVCCVWWPCGEWVVTWGLNSSYKLCSFKKNLIYKVQLYASILSKSLCGASVQSGPQLLSTIVIGQRGGFWIQNISTLGYMAGCARWPCGEWVGTSNLNSSNILCSWNPIYNQTQSDLTSYCHAHYNEVYQATQKPFLKQYFLKQ